MRMRSLFNTLAVVFACGLAGCNQSCQKQTPAGFWSATNQPNVNFRSISFPDVNNGWAVGKKGDIKHTADGGVTWISQITSVSHGDLHGVHFVDAQKGWAIGDGGIILSTVDGGITWGSLPSGTTKSLRQIFFLNASDGWIVGDDTVLVTTGGMSWSPLSLTGPHRGVHFVDPTHGWVVDLGGKISVTTNGGVLWGPQTSGTTKDLYSVYFLDVNNGFAAGGTGWTAGDEDGCVPIAGPPGSVSCTDPGPWSRLVLQTTNQGQTWKSIIDDAYEPVHRILFKDKTHGWMVGGTERGYSRWASSSPSIPMAGRISATYDGGASWSDQYIWAEGKPVYDVTFIDLNNGYAIAADSGQRWKPGPGANNGGYTQQQPPESAIWKTTNGGHP